MSELARTVSPRLPVEEVRLGLGDVDLRLLRAGGMERCVDRDALLTADAPPEPPYWMHLWPGARVLGRRIAAAPECGPGVRVVELGCGLGIPALTAAARGAAVLASDWKAEPLALLRASARLNGVAVATVAMDWRHRAITGGFDLCLGADVAYDAGTEEALVAAIAALVRPGGTAWLADSVNIHRTTIGPALESAGFEVRESTLREEEEGRPVWVRLIEARRRP